MSVLCDMLTSRCLTVAASAIGGIPLMPKLSRERLWIRDVGPVRVSRGPEDETTMANTNPRKPALHGAAAASHSKTDAAKDQAMPSNAKSNDTGRPAVDAGHKNDSGKKSR